MAAPDGDDDRPTETHLAPPAPSSSVRIARYRIVRELGRGGMGTVLLAEDDQLGRLVAIKLIATGSVPADTDLRRFLREARSAARLNHPHIATVYDVGEHQGQPFLAMEFVDGETLSRRLRRGPLAPAEARRVAEQLGAALACAHKAGVVHRDLKPGNVMISKDGGVKLLDFGLARPDAQTPLAAADGPITDTGMVVGTPAYMSPEQARGEAIGAASDVFSLGILLYEALSGVCPFERKSVYEMLNAVITLDPEPIRDVCPSAPDLLAGIIEQCLAKDARERPSSSSLVGMLAAGTVVRTPPSTSTPAIPPMVTGRTVVLPLRNSSGNEAYDWVAAGITDTLVHELRRSEGVTVVGEALLAAELRSGPTEPRAIGERLGAEWVVEAAIQVAGKRLRVTCTVFATRTGEGSSVGRIDGDLDDVFDLQDRLVEEVRTLVEASVRRRSSHVPVDLRPNDFEAFEWCARGRLLADDLRPEAQVEAEGCFRAALERDPDYGMAHVYLGVTRLLRFFATGQPPLTEAVHSLQRALSLDDELSEAHSWLAHALTFTNQLDLALAHAERATELDPENAAGWTFGAIAAYLRVATEGEGPALLGVALERMRRAAIISPLDQSVHANLGFVHMLLGDLDEAERCFAHQRRLEEAGQEPRWVGAQVFSGVCRLMRGDVEAASADLSSGLRRLDGDEHMFALPCAMTARLTLAEVALRSGDAAGSAQGCREAIALAEAYIGVPGMAHALIRGEIGLAKAESRRGRTRESARAKASALLRFDENARRAAGYALASSNTAFALASGLAALGDVEGAAGMLDVAYRHGWACPQELDTDPAFDHCRDDARIGAARERAAAFRLPRR